MHLSQIRLALYQPDIAQNVGSILRLCACFGVALDIIEPCGFPFDRQRVSRSALDYGGHAELSQHASWDAFRQAQAQARLVLLTTKAVQPYHAFSFQPGDILLLGRESAGVPEEVHAAAQARITIPIRAETRSLNVSHAAAIVLAEALRQTHSFP